MRQNREPETWHARAPFWIGLALTALGGFVTVKAQLAGIERMVTTMPDRRDREVDSLERRIASLEARCK